MNEDNYLLEFVNNWPAGTLESLTILWRTEAGVLLPTAPPGDDSKEVFEEAFCNEFEDEDHDDDSVMAFSSKELNEVELLEIAGLDAPEAAALPDKADNALGVFRAPLGKCLSDDSIIQLKVTNCPFPQKRAPEIRGKGTLESR